MGDMWLKFEVDTLITKKTTNDKRFPLRADRQGEATYPIPFNFCERAMIYRKGNASFKT